MKKHLMCWMNNTKESSAHILVSQLQTTLIWAVLWSIARCFYTARAIALPRVHDVKVNIGVSMWVSAMNISCTTRPGPATGLLLLHTRKLHNYPTTIYCFLCTNVTHSFNPLNWASLDQVAHRSRDSGPGEDCCFAHFCCLQQVLTQHVNRMKFMAIQGLSL